MDKLKKYLTYLKNKKKLGLIIFGVIFGAMLLLIGNDTHTEVTTIQNDSPEGYMSVYKRELENEIKNICQSIKGISNVSVLVTLEGGFENIYAKDDSYLTVGNGTSRTPVLIKQNTPIIKGVGIVCKGAESPMAEKEIFSLISAALDISTNRIYIAKGK